MRIIARGSIVALRSSCIALLFGASTLAFADKPSITGISVMSFKGSSETVTISGTGFDTQNTATFTFDPAVVTAMDFKATSTTAATATFTFNNRTFGTVGVTLTQGAATSDPFKWDTGIQCIESTDSGCLLRVEVQTTGVTGSSSQTNNNTTPSIMVTLDYQWRSPNDGKKHDVKGNICESLTPEALKSPTKGGIGDGCGAGPASQKKAGRDNFVAHGILTTGYNQVTNANKLQATPSAGSGSSGAAQATHAAASTGTNSSTNSSTPCTAGSSSATCMAATTQQAFIVDAHGTFGWTTKQDGQGNFAEMGAGVRGQFQDLTPANKLVQTGGVLYLDSSALNTRNVVGLYEGVARFKLSAFGHDQPAIVKTDKATGKTTGKNNGKGNKAAYSNVSDFFVIEAGYQYNSGLQQLAANSQANTKQRFVGRLYLYPEISSTNHTKGLIGVEYSAGVNGGPKVVQVFFGLNANPLKLFAGSKNKSTAPASGS